MSAVGNVCTGPCTRPVLVTANPSRLSLYPRETNEKYLQQSFSNHRFKFLIWNWLFSTVSCRCKDNKGNCENFTRCRMINDDIFFKVTQKEVLRVPLWIGHRHAALTKGQLSEPNLIFFRWRIRQLLFLTCLKNQDPSRFCLCSTERGSPHTL